MLAFPSMLVKPAEEAGIKTPEDPDNFDAVEFPHFQVFCHMQLGQPMPDPSAHWENAKVVAKIPNDKILSITYDEILGIGFSIGFSKP